MERQQKPFHRFQWKPGFLGFDHACSEKKLSLIASGKPSSFPSFLYFPAMLPSFVSPFSTVKALACQTAMIGGGAGFSLYFPCESTEGQSFLVSLSSHRGMFQRPEGYYYPESLERMPLGFDRLEAFNAFQKEMLSMIFPAFVKVFPLAESLGEARFLCCVLSYDQKHESRKVWLSLPARREAQGVA